MLTWSGLHLDSVGDRRLLSVQAWRSTPWEGLITPYGRLGKSSRTSLSAKRGAISHHARHRRRDGQDQRTDPGRIASCR